MKVLIVEDEVLVRKGLTMGIDWHAMGFTKVLEAGNGIEALNIMNEHHIDLMLTDIIMPKMDGLALIKQVSEHYPNVAIVVLSCVNDVDSVREAMKYNRALDFIPKLSISPTALRENIVNLMQRMQKQVNPHAVKSYFTLDDELTLEQCIKTGDNNGLYELMIKIKNQLTPEDNFLDWVDVYAIYNRFLKMHDLYINELTIDGNRFYDYLNDSDDAYEQINRLFTVGEAVIKAIAENRDIRYGSDIAKAIQYIKSHIKDNIKLADVATHIAMNETYLSSLFKQTTGSSFSEYVNQYRIDEAKKLIEHSQKTIYQIAHEVGYSSESYFSRIFKQYVGCSPKSYKKSL